MDPKIDIRLNSRDLIGVAAVWKAPEVITLVVITSIVVGLGSSFLSFVQGNMRKEHALSASYNGYVQGCMSMYFKMYGEPDKDALRFCEKWANTKVRRYENI